MVDVLDSLYNAYESARSQERIIRSLQVIIADQRCEISELRARPQGLDTMCYTFWDYRSNLMEHVSGTPRAIEIIANKIKQQDAVAEAITPLNP